MCSPKNIVLDTLELTVPKRLSKGEVLFAKRRRSKILTQAINGKLLYLNSDRHRDYEKAFHCNEDLFQHGNKIVANYCRKRSCVVCARVYAAKLMAGYVEPLMALTDLQLITLTDVNVKKEKLDEEVRAFREKWRLIYRSVRRISKSFRGFFKLEITYNSRRDDFNVHLHILIEGLEQAKAIQCGWLKRTPTANKRANKIVKVRDQGALIEVFKYVTKAIVKNTFDSRSLDAMYQAIHGSQVYSAFGVKKVKEIDQAEFETTVLTHKEEKIEVWKWCNDVKGEEDWYSPTGERFNNTELDEEVKELVEVVNNSKSHKYEREEYKGPSFDTLIQRNRGKREVLF